MGLIDAAVLNNFIHHSGRGGMASKIDAATSAVAPGSTCSACIVASGADLNCIRSIFGPRNKYSEVGTLFLTPGSPLEKQAIKDEVFKKVSFDEDFFCFSSAFD